MRGAAAAPRLARGRFAIMRALLATVPQDTERTPLAFSASPVVFAAPAQLRDADAPVKVASFDH
jgi:hypothetical protein